MSEQKKNSNLLGLEQEIDIYCMAKDVLRNWWIILLIGLSAALLTYVNVNRSYQPSYSIETVYVVTSKGANTSVFDNLSTTKDTAVRFSQIINSSTLQKKVAEELGTGSIPGTITTETIPETNLLKLKVTARNPRMAYLILQSVMKNYPTISEYLIGNAIMEVLIDPVIPTEPDAEPNVSGPMKKAFLLGAAVVIFMIAIFSYFKDTVHKTSEVERKLDTRLLGAVCHEEKNKTIASKFNKKKTSLLVTNPTVSFRYVEMVQKTCWKIKNKMEQHNAKTLLVTSCLENEGKSTVAANVALNLAENGKKVVLVDLDLRKPSQYKIFDMEKLEGAELGDVLLGKSPAKELIQKLEDKNIYGIFNVKEYNRSTEMLTTGKLRTIIKYLRDTFDYVIIDTPPMAYVADTEEIADMADASLVVVREDTASAKDINDMLDVLQNCSAVSIGCVFNDAHSGIDGALFNNYGKSYGYGKYYGKYYGSK